jgi:hypothetical protein
MCELEVRCASWRSDVRALQKKALNVVIGLHSLLRLQNKRLRKLREETHYTFLGINYTTLG